MAESGFINPTLLGTCPKCKQKEQVTISSRKTKDNFIRRRKECRACKHRATTYEVDESFYVLTKAMMPRVLALAELVKNAPDKELCDTCFYNYGNRCSHEVPEYGTEEAADCVLYLAK